MHSKQTYYFGGRQKCNWVYIIEYQKVNPETKKHVKVRERKRDICGRNKWRFFACKGLKVKNWGKKGLCKKEHCSLISNSARCDPNGKGDILKLHDKCPNAKCNCQKQITFSPSQFQLEGAGFKHKLAKIFKGTQTVGNIFLKPFVNVAAPFTVWLLKPKLKVLK